MVLTRSTTSIGQVSGTARASAVSRCRLLRRKRPGATFRSAPSSPSKAKGDYPAVLGELGKACHDFSNRGRLLQIPPGAADLLSPLRRRDARAGGVELRVDVLRE